MGQVSRVVRLVATVRLPAELEPEPTLEFGPIPNSSRGESSGKAYSAIDFRR